MSVPRPRLHPDGPEVSGLVWGLWRALQSEETATPDRLARMIAQCIDLGITSFDHADIYGAYRVEALFGEALSIWGGARRQIEIVTKCGIRMVHPARPEHRFRHYDTSAAHIRSSVEASLRNLRTDYLDVLLLHRPDPLLDGDETAAALEELVAAGKVRHVGVSNHLPAPIELLQSRLKVPLVTNQIEFSVARTEPLDDGTLDQAQRLRFRPMAWSPLGGGKLLQRLAGAGSALGDALDGVAAELGAVEPAQVALAWLMRHPSRPVPVIGTCRAERLRSLANACAITLDRQQWFRILAASRERDVP